MRPRSRRGSSDLINACRNLRSEMNVAPSQRIPLLAVGDEAKLRLFFPTCRHWPGCPRPALSIACRRWTRRPRWSADVRLMLHIKIDVAAEIARIEKEIGETRR